jgi:hypothetical protein
MLQQWLNVTGLTFDFIGVILLSYEWWIALKADEREMAFARQEQQTQKMREMRKIDSPGFKQMDRFKDQIRLNEQMQRTRTVLGMRRGWFVAALALICGGFFLQILGSLPGL